MATEHPPKHAGRGDDPKLEEPIRITPQPRENKPLKLKVAAISALAEDRPNDEGAKEFKFFIMLRGMSSYGLFKTAYPNEAERLQQIKEIMGTEKLKQDLDKVNAWLRREKRPDLELDMDEMLRMRYADNI